LPQLDSVWTLSALLLMPLIFPPEAFSMNGFTTGSDGGTKKLPWLAKLFVSVRTQTRAALQNDNA